MQCNCILSFIATEEYVTCSALGDPHYMTFDGKYYDFMGKCKYVLAKDTDDNFKILVQNKKCGNEVTCAEKLTLILKDRGRALTLEHGGVVKCHGMKLSLPYRSQSKLKMFYSLILRDNSIFNDVHKVSLRSVEFRFETFYAACKISQPSTKPSI